MGAKQKTYRNANNAQAQLYMFATAQNGMRVAHRTVFDKICKKQVKDVFARRASALEDQRASGHVLGTAHVRVTLITAEFDGENARYHKVLGPLHDIVNEM